MIPPGPRHKVVDWAHRLAALGNIVRRFPQTAYAGLVKSLPNEWIYLQQVTSGNGDLYKPIERAIWEDFLPALLYQPSIGDNLRNHIVLVLKRAGLGIPDPTTSTEDNHAASMDCFFVLVESLMTGDPLDIQ